MANFFDEKRFECDECKGQIFEEVDSFMLIKDITYHEKHPHKTLYRCLKCGKLHEVKVR